MDQNLGETSRPSCTYFSPDALTKVDDAGPNNKSPALVSEAVVGCVKGEYIAQGWVSAIPDEAPSGVSIQSDHEEKRQVVGVPKGFKALLADLLVSSCIHEHHDKEHEVSSDASWLGVVDLQCKLLSDFCYCLLDIFSRSILKGGGQTYGFSRH